MLQQQIITMLCCLLQHYGSPKHAAFACTAQVPEVYQSSGLRTILPIRAVHIFFLHKVNIKCRSKPYLFLNNVAGFLFIRHMVFFGGATTLNDARSGGMDSPGTNKGRKQP